jgi:hypothetical protein
MTTNTIILTIESKGRDMTPTKAIEGLAELLAQEIEDSDLKERCVIEAWLKRNTIAYVKVNK